MAFYYLKIYNFKINDYVILKFINFYEVVIK